MSIEEDPISQKGSTAPRPASQPKPQRSEEQAAAKPPILWMIVPIILVCLAIYLAR
jgi:hypothetical protein